MSNWSKMIHLGSRGSSILSWWICHLSLMRRFSREQITRWIWINLLVILLSVIFLKRLFWRLDLMTDVNRNKLSDAGVHERAGVNHRAITTLIKRKCRYHVTSVLKGISRFISYVFFEVFVFITSQRRNWQWLLRRSRILFSRKMSKEIVIDFKEMSTGKLKILWSFSRQRTTEESKLSCRLSACKSR